MDHGRVAAGDRHEILIGPRLAIGGRSAAETHVEFQIRQDRAFAIIAAQGAHGENLAGEADILVRHFAINLDQAVRVVQRQG